MIKRDAVYECLKLYQDRLGLSHWDISLVFREAGWKRSATCTAEPEYRKAIITLNLHRIKPEDLSAYIRHELFHCYVWPMAQMFMDFIEDGDKFMQEQIRQKEEALTTAFEMMPLWDELEDTS